MNEQIILAMAAPYVRDHAITYDEFDKIYSVLSRREQYTVTEILFRNGIGLVDEHIGDNVLIMNIEDPIESDDSFEDDDFEVRYDDTLFRDKGISGDRQTELLVSSVIRQSNEILCTLIQQGSRQAAQDLCIKNKKLVDKYVAAYEKRSGNHLDFEDLEQSGFIGLLKAAEKFSPEQGYAFSTYAVYWIKQYIAREIMDNGYAIRIPVHMMERINKVSAMNNRLINEGILQEARILAIARELGYTEDQVRECLILKQNYLTYASLDTPVGEDSDTELGDFIPTEEEESVEHLIMDMALRQELEASLTSLTEREQAILKLRVGWDNGQPKTLEEIGAIYGVTRERIRQLETKALRKMRHVSRSRRLKVFWEE